VNEAEQTNLEPELGGIYEMQLSVSGLEPTRWCPASKSAYVDEVTCIGLRKHCAVAVMHFILNRLRSTRNTPDGDLEELIQAVDTCPLIASAQAIAEVKKLEEERRYQVIPLPDTLLRLLLLLTGVAKAGYPQEIKP